jgi:hypothetical protein
VTSVVNTAVNSGNRNPPFLTMRRFLFASFMCFQRVDEEPTYVSSTCVSNKGSK